MNRESTHPATTKSKTSNEIYALKSELRENIYHLTCGQFQKNYPPRQFIYLFVLWQQKFGYFSLWSAERLPTKLETLNISATSAKLM
jgi:hypothetical protein